MARRRLLTILATTVVAGGLSAAPAFAGPLDDLTGGLEDAVATVTDEVQGVTDGLTGGTSTEGDASTLDLGTGDGTLDVDLDVDIAPRDGDGSPQLEIDGGVTIADQEIDLGSATDPIEDAVDPDPAPAPSPSPSPTTDIGTGDAVDGEASPTSPATTGGRHQEGDGVVAASTGDGPAVFSPEDSPFAQAVGEGLAGAGALQRTSFGVKRHGGDAMSVEQVRDPEVAPPVDTAVDSPWTAAPPAEPETPAVLATDTAAGVTDDSPVPGLLRVIAAAMVLGTAAVWTRAFRRA